MSPRLFFGVLLVIMLGWAAAGTYASMQKLEYPVFLDHYIDVYEQESLQLQFYYLTNKGDPNGINMVALGDIPGFIDQYHDFFMEGTPYVQRNGPHELRTVSVSLDMYEVKKLKEKLVIDEMTVYLTDGESFTADIGEVIIHPTEDNNFLMSQSSSGDGEMTATYFQLEEEMTVLGLTPHLPDAGLADLKVHIPNKGESFSAYNFMEKIDEELNEGKGEDFRDVNYPLNLKEGDEMGLSIRQTGEVKYVLNSWMVIEGEDRNGKTLKVPANLYHIPELTLTNVKAIIERKGAAH